MENMRANIDFCCLDDDCGTSIEFNLMELEEKGGVVSCPSCHKQYELSDEEFVGKLKKLRKLLLAVKDAEDILGECSVGVATVNGETKIPYRLLLTRLNTLITLELGDRKVDFHFRVEPLVDGSFR